jgi:hypothetical protein
MFSLFALELQRKLQNDFQFSVIGLHLPIWQVFVTVCKICLMLIASFAVTCMGLSQSQIFSPFLSPYKVRGLWWECIDFHNDHHDERSRGSAVGNDWLLTGRPRSQSLSPGGVKNSIFSTLSRPALRPTQPPIQWVPGALSPGVKQPGREADHSPPTGAEVKKMWIYTSTPPYTFMAYVVFN